jgi:hypothetical protein
MPLEVERGPPSKSGAERRVGIACSRQASGAGRGAPGPRESDRADQKKFWHSVKVMSWGQTLMEEVMLLKP